MIAPSIFSKLVDYVKWLFAFFLNIPTMLKNQFFATRKNLHALQYNLKNFAEANINLGIYHLNNQNYNDAIFRFMLVDKFMRPNDPFVNYWMGWTYFLKNNHKKAIIHLEKGAIEDKIDLLKFIKTINNVTRVPSKIYSIYRGMTMEDVIDKFFNKGYDLPKNLVIQLVGAIDNLPEKYSILEIGSNVGLAGQEIQKRMRDGFTLTAVESSLEMVKLQTRSGRDIDYDRVITSPIEEYLAENTNEKYNIIISVDGFSMDSELSIIFKQITNRLSDEGYFAFALRTSSGTKFSEKYLEFSYDKSYVNQVLNSCGLKAIVDLDLGLLMKDDYCIFVCKK
jgi:tetratricopeptide (TPR) repeat protein